MCRKDYNDRWQCKALVTLRERSCGKVMCCSHVLSSYAVHMRESYVTIITNDAFYLTIHGSPQSPLFTWTIIPNPHTGTPYMDMLELGPPLYRSKVTHSQTCSNFLNSNLTLQGSSQTCSNLFIMKHVQLASRRLASYLNAFLFYCAIATDHRQSDDPPGAKRWIRKQVWSGNRTGGERWNHAWGRTRFAICMASKLTQLCTSLPCYSEPQSRA